MKRLVPCLLLACGPPDAGGKGDTDLVVDSGVEETDVARDADTGPDASVASHLLGDDTVTVAVSDPSIRQRTYTLRTTADLRDDLPEGGVREVVEHAGAPVLRTGSLLLDALFAMAWQEALDNQVGQIRDGAFADGQGVPCDCFETGEKWNYVWTRDTAYAADLGLGWVDPERAMRSLGFKLSRPKEGGALRIVQDTGSGGSWPVSTDRVVWALGARAVLPHLDEPLRSRFAADALEAMDTTLAEDRAHVHDPVDGLYRGEASFLDWREQHYPPWTRDDVVSVAMSKALSTNLAHLALMHTAIQLGEAAGHPDVDTWRSWSQALRAAILEGFSLEDGRLAAFVGAPLDPAVRPRFELLGQALAVREGLVSGASGRSLLASYPRFPGGTPVVWPQDPQAAIYHNQATWPFVTAYDLLAAKQVGHMAAYAHGVDSLIAGAGRNLSNLENLEATTQRAYLDDGERSGPVVNSRRQLWSVAGYLGMSIEGLFGVRAAEVGVVVAPMLPPLAAYGVGDEDLLLRDLHWRGATFSVRVVMTPDVAAAGATEVARVERDGVVVEGPLSPGELDGSELVVHMVPAAAATADLTIVDPSDRDRWMAPATPAAPSVARDGDDLVLTFGAPPAGVTQVWRDGEEVAASVAGATWRDVGAAAASDTPCYALTAEGAATDAPMSHPSPAVCWWGDEGERVQVLDAHAFVATSEAATWSDAPVVHHLDWGAPGDRLVVAGIQPRFTGPHLVQLVHANGAGPINTGITAASKWVRVVDEASGSLLAEGLASLPHTGAWDRYLDGDLLAVDLDAARSVRLEISAGPNMTWLEHFRSYTGGEGGGASPSAYTDVHAVKLLAMDGVEGAWRPLTELDGDGDLAALGGGEAPGVPLGDDRVAVSLDDRNLELVVRSDLFAEGYAPLMVYLEADPQGAAVPSTGVRYDRGAVVDQPAELPFTPTHHLTLRSADPDSGGPAGGPYSGVWVSDGADFRLLRRFTPGQDAWWSGDGRTVALRVPLALLGHPTSVRLVVHGLWGEAGNEWKVAWPTDHAPWVDGGGGYQTLTR